jgi:predicted AAA+ superfamily ATPase
MIIENIAGPLVESVFSQRYFYRYKQKNEVDAILEEKDTLKPLEVKYQSIITDSDLKGMKAFWRRYPSSMGIMATKDRFELKSVNGTPVLFIPAWVLGLISR